MAAFSGAAILAGMEDDLNTAEVACLMIRSFGDRAAAIMDRRAEDHVRAGEAEGADFWRRVGQAIRSIEVSLSASAAGDDRPERPHRRPGIFSRGAVFG
jgi:hypothetical protein